MFEFKPPVRPDLTEFDEMPITTFLAGTIDMGNSVDWQRAFVEKYYEDIELVFFNPRRSDWDSTWAQSKYNENFVGQVNWEMDHLILSDIIIFNFEKDSKSPITFFELGAHVSDRTKHVLVRCPNGFYRKGNIDIICQRANVPVYETIEELHAAFKYIVYQNRKFKNAKK